MNFVSIFRYRLVRLGAATFCALLTNACAHGAPAEEAAKPAPPLSSRLDVDPDGTVSVPQMSVPLSEYISEGGQAYIVEHLMTLRTPELMTYAEELGAPIFLKAYIERQKQLFPVNMVDTEIAGVRVYDYTPATGVAEANKSRVLINLHGGGFINCWPACAELESMPVSALGGFRVVSPEYRQGPDHAFPAASEDVAKIYAELLKSYPPENVGIFGCSAGGMLTGMSLAWFQKHGLPTPGAAGIYCAGATSGFGGDSNFTATAIGEGRFFAPPAIKPGAPSRPRMAYLAEADPLDPLVAPVMSDEVLSKFPPTQLITGTRSFDLSATAYTHSRLVALGVEADLHIWEGMFHGFYTNPDVPESREAYDVMIRFFDTHLGSSPISEPGPQ